MPEIEVHPSIGKLALDDVLAASLRANRLDPKLLYVSDKQAALWREVFLKHSPIHGNPEFVRIYGEAFGQVAGRLPAGRIWLIGLGCGTGLKEEKLCRCVSEHGREVEFSAIDVSRELVLEAAKRLAAAGADAERHVVCDLAEVEFIRRWLDEYDPETPRVFTFFGLVPNLQPAFVTKLLGGILRPIDVLLASVHLAPVGNGVDPAAAMKKVLPQYDNVETLAWLQAARDEFELREVLVEPRMVIGECEAIPCLQGLAAWKAQSNPDFVLFQSLRYTPALFADLLQGHGLAVEQLAMTACREEAIWSVRCASSAAGREGGLPL